MAQQNSSPISPDDDPNSELNILRREVRKLQASVRDAVLQIASQQDDLIDLRKNLAAAEVEVEEGLVREANLRMQLELQSMKRQKVESTMAAAETLIESLKEMVQEGDYIRDERVVDPVEPRPVKEYPRNPFGTRKETGNFEDMGGAKLDQVLNSISEPPVEERDDHAEEEEGAEIENGLGGIQEGTTLSYAEGLPYEGSESDVVTQSEQVQRDSTGDTADLSTISMDDIDKDPEQNVVTPTSPPFSERRLSAPSLTHNILASHEGPRSLRNVPAAVAAPVQKRASNLLKSAFKPGSAVTEQATTAIRSAGVDLGNALPTEVASIAKAEGAPPPVLLPSSVAAALSDAHSGEIYALAASKDCMWTASGGDDKLIVVYDKSGAPYATITENTRAVTALEVQRDVGNQVSDIVIHAGGSDGSVRTFRKSERRKTKWNMTTVSPVHSQAVRKIVGIDGPGESGLASFLLSCSLDRTVRICDVEQGKRLFSANTQSAVLDVDAFEGPSGLIASGHKDGGLRIWCSKDASNLVGGGKAHNKGIISVSCLNDGLSVVTLGRDNVIRLNDIRMNVAVVREMERGVHCVSDWHRVATNGRYVACGFGKNALCIWNVDSGKIVRRVSSQVTEPDADVLDMVARKLRNPGCVVVPLWSASGHFVGAHRARQVSFWNIS